MGGVEITHVSEHQWSCSGKNCEIHKTLFATLITVNGIAVIFTFYLLSIGMSEANPVVSFFLDVHPYAMIGFVFLMWMLMYYLTVYQPQRYGGMVKHVGFYCLVFSNVWLAIDAMHDLHMFVRVI